jgi:hypothetical protein
MPGWDEQLLRPVLARACGILDQALAGADAPILEWGYVENRPALRSLVRTVHLEQRCGNGAEANRLAERLLALNPGDNHGIRVLVMESHLRSGRDREAVELAERYPEDMHADLPYGRALALYRMGREQAAQTAARSAIEALPKVARTLLAKSPRRPRIDVHAIRVGGDDQAWLYREAMLDAWQATAGALDWLRRVRKT